MMIRILWPLTLFAIGACACALQLDRQARYAPGLSQYVPAPARYFAQYHIARNAQANGTPNQAMAAARRLVERRPMAADHLRLLAQAQIAAGDHDAAFQSIQHAAKRGWRDRRVQQAMLAIAISAGDDAEAARRLAALWLLDPGDDQLPLLARQVLASPQARHAFADIAAGSDRWRDRFLRYGGRIMATEIHADITARIGAIR